MNTDNKPLSFYSALYSNEYSCVTADNKPLSFHERIYNAKKNIDNHSFVKSGEVRAREKTMYKYFELQDIMPHINSILHKEDLVALFTFKIQDGFLYPSIILSDKLSDSKMELESMPISTDMLMTSPVIHNNKGSSTMGSMMKDYGMMMTYIQRYAYRTIFSLQEECMAEVTIGEQQSMANNNLPNVPYQLSKNEVELLERVCKFITNNNLEMRKFSVAELEEEVNKRGLKDATHLLSKILTHAKELADKKKNTKDLRFRKI